MIEKCSSMQTIAILLAMAISFFYSQKQSNNRIYNDRILDRMNQPKTAKYTLHRFWDKIGKDCIAVF